MQIHLVATQPFRAAGDDFFITTVVFGQPIDRLDEMNTSVHLELGDQYPPGLMVRVDTSPQRLGDLATTAGRYADGLVLLEYRQPGCTPAILGARLTRLNPGAVVRLPGRRPMKQHSMFDNNFLLVSP